MNTIERKYTAKEAMQSVVEYLNDNAVRATKVITIRTISESERKLFVRLFGHWLHKNRKKIFLLADSVSSLQALEQCIITKYNGIKVVETATLEEHGVSDDMILNRINGTEIDCIIVSLSQDVEESFVAQNRMSLNAKVWFGVGTKKEWKQEKSWFDKVKELVTSSPQNK